MVLAEPKPRSEPFELICLMLEIKLWGITCDGDEVEEIQSRDIKHILICRKILPFEEIS